MNKKSLVMCHLDGHWLPFEDEDMCMTYLLRLKTELHFDISKVRIFYVTFVETNLNLK